MLILVVQQWHTLLVDWQQWTYVTKNFIFVCHQSHVVRSYKCCFEKSGSAKVVKHWKSEEKCGMSIWCTGTTEGLVKFVFPNSTKSKENLVALELWLLGNVWFPFSLKMTVWIDAFWWCAILQRFYHLKYLTTQLSSIHFFYFSNVSPNAKLVVAKLGLFE